MKTKTLLLSAFLVLIATGCQKDNTIIENSLHEESIQQCQVANYTIDGIAYYAVIQNETAYSALIQQLIALAQSGHHITITIGTQNHQDALAKEEVHFQTKDEKEMEKWAQQMSSDGYSVDITYKDGVYHGTATKK